MSPRIRHFRTAGRLMRGAVTALVVCAMMAAGTACRPKRDDAQPVRLGAGRRSADCRACHEAVYAAWAGSHHARAHRDVAEALDREALTATPQLQQAGVGYSLAWRDGKPWFQETIDGVRAEPYAADFVLGHTPLQQYIVPVGGGRYQAAELAYAPTTKQWFNVFGDERRRPGEWGHWRGRGMNWNAMCAHCHTTQFEKRYVAASDTYDSRWLEQGVGCVQCHAGLTDDHGTPGATDAKRSEPAWADRKAMQDTCAPCHARNELLTGRLVPGGRYADYYRLTLPNNPREFYPDGQVRDEDFNATSLVTSRMGAKGGVTCLDCHEGHSGRVRLPVENNALCLQCHAVAGPRGAPVIDPTAHSHHGAASTGNRCVECHMPTTTYMQRDPRHDHGFLKPDPLLTRERGIPNACSRCHSDRTLDQLIADCDLWYGDKMASTQRARARAMSAAQQGDPAAAELIVRVLEAEDVPAWRATLLLVARDRQLRSAELNLAARRALTDGEPLLRSAAVQFLAASETADRELLRPHLQDDRRLVRLDAAWALADELPNGSAAATELETYLDTMVDQPAGRLRRAQALLNRGHPAEAEADLRQAIAWDPAVAAYHHTLGFALSTQQRLPEAAEALWRAALLAPDNAQMAFDAALGFAEAGRLAETEQALRATVARAPRFDRAWYNLGLLLAQQSRYPEAIAALKHAEEIASRVADYPYARATVHERAGDHAAARAAAARAIEIDPQHAAARRLLESR